MEYDPQARWGRPENWNATGVLKEPFPIGVENITRTVANFCWGPQIWGFRQVILWAQKIELGGVLQLIYMWFYVDLQKLDIKVFLLPLYQATFLVPLAMPGTVEKNAQHLTMMGKIGAGGGGGGAAPAAGGGGLSPDEVAKHNKKDGFYDQGVPEDWGCLKNLGERSQIPGKSHDLWFVLNVI